MASNRLYTNHESQSILQSVGLRFTVNPPFRDLPHINALLSAFPRNYLVHDYQTTLSIKTVVSGAARYSTPNGRYLVTPDVFLVLNQGQRYAMEVDESSRTETLCPFFESGFVESAAGSLALTDERQLDHPGGTSKAVEFFERLYPMTGRVAEVLGSMSAAIHERRASADWVEDRFHDLAEALLVVRADARREMLRFPAVRRTTREELYRRLYRARDFLMSCYAEPLSVADAASIAALSPFHFHRTFKRAFGRSPMQFLQARRLDVARRMLEAGADVTTVSLAVGFESLGSFSWLFRRRFGVPPSALRKKQD